MKKLLNTLYVSSENSYLALDGENVVLLDQEKEAGRIPLHNLEGIVSFGYRGTSPALMGACAERQISLCYLTPRGKFLARVTGKVKGMWCCGSSNMREAGRKPSVWILPKTVFWGRYITPDGYWSGRFAIIPCRSTQNG